MTSYGIEIMADKTKIEWSDATWNPIVGCSVVSPGCTHCYAMRDACVDADDGGCFWVEEDLCSVCAARLQQSAACPK